MKTPIALLIALLLVPLATVRAAEADVIVYGSTPGGFCAAIAAAREGASVILLEPTDHVGGVNTGGLCFSDSNQTVRSTVMGLFDEWHTRIETDYTSRGIKQVLDIPVLPAPSPEKKGAMSIAPAKLPGIVLDDKQATLEGEWKSSSGFKPFIGTGYVHDDKRGDGHSIATFRFKAPKSGRYDLRVAYSPHETRAKKVPITIESGAQKSALSFDQTQPLPAGEAFRSAGLIQLTSDAETKIVISNTGTEGFVILDAIQLIEAKE